MPKKPLRQTIKSLALATQQSDGAAFDARIADLFFESQYFMPQSVIAGFLPLKGEVSCIDIFERLRNQGHITALPVVIARDMPMIFRTYNNGDSTRSGLMGQQEPLPYAREIFPDVLIIPMLGFTRAGYRLGYGSGFYDRTLPALKEIKPVKTIGVAYSIQEIPDMPIDPHDVPLDIIITEKEVIKPA